jgi:hypothetical protein
MHSVGFSFDLIIDENNAIQMNPNRSVKKYSFKHKFNKYFLASI